MTDRANSLSLLIGAILGLVGLALFLQGNFYLLALVVLPLLVGGVVLLAMTIGLARTGSPPEDAAHRALTNRGIRIGAGIVIIAALGTGLYSLASGGTVLPTPTGAPALTFHPSTTVTASPLDIQSPEPQQVSTALQTLLCVIVWIIPLAIAFTRPGAWDRRIRREILVGFLGWFLINTLLWLWVDYSLARAHPASGAGFFQLERAVPILVNLLAIPLVFFTRRWMALGVFSAIVVNAIGTLLVTPISAFYGDRALVRIIAAIPFYLPPFHPSL